MGKENYQKSRGKGTEKGKRYGTEKEQKKNGRRREININE